MNPGGERPSAWSDPGGKLSFSAADGQILVRLTSSSGRWQEAEIGPEEARQLLAGLTRLLGEIEA